MVFSPTLTGLGERSHLLNKDINLDTHIADIVNVIRLIAEISGENIITGEDVKGKVTLRLRSVPWDKARQTVLELIRETARQGATVVLSSHDLAEVSSVCGRAAILREGRLIELAPVAEIVRQGELRIKARFSPEGSRPPASRWAKMRR